MAYIKAKVKSYDDKAKPESNGDKASVSDHSEYEMHQTHFYP
jgi:hypothetical protein